MSDTTPLELSLPGGSQDERGIMYLPDQGSLTSDATTVCEGRPQPACRCNATCACRNPLQFPRRVLALPPVRAAVELYARVKRSHATVACALTAAEVGALLAAAPARLAARPLREALATPVYVADLLLCKGLDLAQRMLPCIAQSPATTLNNFAICTCLLPAGACLLCARAIGRSARTCLCDAPAVLLGTPALAGLALAELCLCSAPRALCQPPVRVAGRAARGALRDVSSLLEDANRAADFCAARFTKD